MELIEFIGLGNMGVPIANRLSNAGFAVRAKTRDGQRRPELDPSVEVSSLTSADAIAPDAVIFCVPDELAIRAALEASNCLTRMREGTLVIDMGTTGISGAVWLGGECAKRGLHFVDAPVSGGVVGAREGNLTIFMGGHPEAFDRAKTLLSHCGTAHRIGDVGAGQAAKLANQIIVADTIAAVCEGLEFARQLGLDREKLLVALSGGFADSRVMQVHGPKIATQTYGTNGPIRLHLKDLKLAQSANSAAFARLSVVNEVKRVFVDLAANSHAETDHSAYALKFQEELAS